MATGSDPWKRKENKPVWLRDYADPRKCLEKVVYEWVAGIYGSAGVEVIRHSQPFKTAQTPGIWDVECYYRRHVTETIGRYGTYSFIDAEGQAWDIFHWGHEVKRHRQTAAPGQVDFHRRLSLFNVPTVVGGLNTAIRQLAELGIAQFEERPDHW